MSTHPSFDLQLEHDGGTARIAPRGELDIATAPEFERAISDAAGDATSIIIDLRGLTFMDSTGLRALVQTDQRARSEGFELKIVRGVATIDRLFAVSGLDEHLPLVEAPAE